LARLFQQPFLYGIASSKLGLDLAPFARLRAFEELLALGEVVGAVRTECPEQGLTGAALAGGIAELAGKIEHVLGLSLAFPNVGGAYGFALPGGILTPETPEHLYVALRIREMLQRQDQCSLPVRVVEVGAGFGGTAFWLSRVCPAALHTYTILDLPLINVCQGSFLSKAFGPDAVRLHGEAAAKQLFHVLPSHAKHEIHSFDLLVNENSMPEIPEPAVCDYLTWAQSSHARLFYSYNQEALSPVDGELQTLVPAVATRVGFQRLSRNASWVRRGYVEEIYAIPSGPAHGSNGTR
jgi:hypothetical protein